MPTSLDQMAMNAPLASLQEVSAGMIRALPILQALAAQFGHELTLGTNSYVDMQGVNKLHLVKVSHHLLIWQGTPKVDGIVLHSISGTAEQVVERYYQWLLECTGKLASDQPLHRQPPTAKIVHDGTREDLQGTVTKGIDDKYYFWDTNFMQYYGPYDDMGEAMTDSWNYRQAWIHQIEWPGSGDRSWVSIDPNYEQPTDIADED